MEISCLKETNFTFFKQHVRHIRIFMIFFDKLCSIFQIFLYDIIIQKLKKENVS